MTTNLIVEICGYNLAMLETPVNDKTTGKPRADGRTWHTVREADKGASMAGIPIKALADKLPTSIVVDGVKITLKSGMTPAVDKRTGAIKVPRKCVTGTIVVPMPSLGMEKRKVSVSISERTGGGWQLKVGANRPGGASGSMSPERLDLNLAGLLATA